VHRPWVPKGKKKRDGNGGERKENGGGKKFRSDKRKKKNSPLTTPSVADPPAEPRDGGGGKNAPVGIVRKGGARRQKRKGNPLVPLTQRGFMTIEEKGWCKLTFLRGRKKKNHPNLKEGRPPICRSEEKKKRGGKSNKSL